MPVEAKIYLVGCLVTLLFFPIVLVKVYALGWESLKNWKYHAPAAILIPCSWIGFIILCLASTMHLAERNMRL